MTDRDLLGLARLNDKHGVLSIYLTADPSELPGSHPAWQIRIRGELAALRERVKAEGPRDRWLALVRRLGSLETTLEALLDPREHGLGRALFAPLADGEVRQVAIQLPLPDLVVLERTAYVLPLLTAYELGAPAGVAVVSRESVQLLHWALGKAEPVKSVRYPARVNDREPGLTPAAHPEAAQKGPAYRELIERRLEENVSRFIRAAGHETRSHALARGWDLLVVAGDAHLAETFEAGLREQGSQLQVVHVHHVLSSATPVQVAAAVADDLLAARTARRSTLAEQARSAALAGGPGAYGLDDTIDALNEGRVARLLLDRAGRWRGHRAPDGRLAPLDEQLPGVEPDELVPDEHLAERMVERALATGAAVTVLDGAEAEALAPAGVAALLRW